MHVSSGLITHLTEKILQNLQSIDNETSWEGFLKKAVEDSRKYTKRDRELEGLRKINSRYVETEMHLKDKFISNKHRTILTYSMISRKKPQ